MNNRLWFEIAADCLLAIVMALLGLGAAMLFASALIILLLNVFFGR